METTTDRPSVTYRDPKYMAGDRSMRYFRDCRNGGHVIVITLPAEESCGFNDPGEVFRFGDDIEAAREFWRQKIRDWTDLGYITIEEWRKRKAAKAAATQKGA